jgi:FdhD protein
MTQRTPVLEPSQPVRYEHFRDGRLERTRRNLAEEVALEILVNGRSYSLLMETPGQELELVYGYLFTEGMIDTASQVSRVTLQKGPDFLGAEGLQALAELPAQDMSDALPDRLSISLSSCGLCGKDSLDQVGRGVSRVRSRQHFSWATLSDLAADLRNHQPLYEETRGVHAVAVYDASGAFMWCFEDVGRHNALDKAVGHALLNDIALDDKMIILSGRASLEMILKAARARIPLFLCFSNPTVLAIEAAKALNITLVSRESDHSLAAYTHTRRIEQDPSF